MKDHRQIDERSLAFGRAIAARLAQHPELIARAQTTVTRWLQTCSAGARPTLLEWQNLLAGPLDGVIALLSGTDERSIRLRQSNPFAGVLSQEERKSLLKQYDSYDAAPA